MTNTSLLALTSEQLLCLDQMLDAAAILCERDPLALFQEGHLKVALVDRVLRTGHTIREGSHNTAKDWLIRQADGRTSTEMVARPPREKGDGSRDIRIENPSLHVELKCFGEFGSKDFFQRDDAGLAGDLGRVRSGVADAAIVAVAGKLYDDARGDKSDTRGRKPKPESVFGALLPSRDELPVDSFHRFRGMHMGTTYAVFARKVVAPAGVNGTGHRVVVGFVKG